MKKQILTAIVVFSILSCHKSVDSPVGNVLYRWSLKSYTGPEFSWKTVTSDSMNVFKDDGIVFSARQVIEIVNGQPQWVNKYSGTIYQGKDKYWPTKPDFTFETTFVNDSTLKLGNDAAGFNIANFNGAGEELKIIELFPVKGRTYVYYKVSD